MSCSITIRWGWSRNGTVRSRIERGGRWTGGRLAKSRCRAFLRGAHRFASGRGAAKRRRSLRPGSTPPVDLGPALRNAATLERLRVRRRLSSPGAGATCNPTAPCGRSPGPRQGPTRCAGLRRSRGHAAAVRCASGSETARRREIRAVPPSASSSVRRGSGNGGPWGRRDECRVGQGGARRAGDRRGRSRSGRCGAGYSAARRSNSASVSAKRSKVSRMGAGSRRSTPARARSSSG